MLFYFVFSSYVFFYLIFSFLFLQNPKIYCLSHYLDFCPKLGSLHLCHTAFIWFILSFYQNFLKKDSPWDDFFSHTEGLLLFSLVKLLTPEALGGAAEPVVIQVPVGCYVGHYGHYMVFISHVSLYVIALTVLSKYFSS